MSHTIQLPSGAIDLVDPPIPLLRQIRDALPWGIAQLDSHPNVRAGIVMQCGQEELFAIKLQPPDTDQESALTLLHINRCLIAAALPFYFNSQFKGLLIPGAYIKEKPNNTWESGIACFAFPHPEVLSRPDYEKHDDLDSDLRPGAFTLFAAFIKATQHAAALLNITPQRPIGIDARKRLSLGTLSLDFLLLDQELLCLKRDLRPQDLVWSILLQHRITQLWHLPSVPLAINPEDLPVTKGS